MTSFRRPTAPARRIAFFLIAVGALALAMVLPLRTTHALAAACDTSWNGANADWLTGGDWSSGVPGAASNACLPAGAYTVTITGESVQAGTLTIGAGATVNMQITGCGPASAILTMHGDLTNAGTIDMSNLGDACGGTDQIIVPPGSTLINTGTVATLGCCRGDRQITGSVTNQGTFSMNNDSYTGIGSTGLIHFDGPGSLFNNQGAFTVDDNMLVELTGGSGQEFRNSSGGSVVGVSDNEANEVNGQLVVPSGAMFTQDAGTTSGMPVLLSGGATLHITGSGAGNFDLRGDGGQNTISGSTIAAGQTVTLNIHGCGVVSSIATLASSMTNAGTIDLGNADDGCGGTAQLIIPGGDTLTNTGTIATVGCCRGNREITGSVTNQGTITVNTIGCCATTLNLDGAGLFDNKSTFDIKDGMTATIPSSTGLEFRDDAGGSVDGEGSTGQLVVDSGNIFTEGAGTTVGNSVLLQGGATLHFTGAGASSFDLRGDQGTNTISGSTIAAGQTVTLNIHGCGVVSSIADLATSMTNAGTIHLGNANDGCGGVDQIVVPGGDTLTNTGTIDDTGCCRGERELTGNVTNDGTINVSFIGGSGGTFQVDPGVIDDFGTLTVADGMTFTNVDDTVIVEPGGTFTLVGAGTYTQQSSATLGVTVNATNTTYTGITGGDTNLDGTLHVTTIGSPAATTTWPIIAGASRSGTFATNNFGGTGYNTQYTATGLTLQATGTSGTVTHPSTTTGSLTPPSGGHVTAGTTVYDQATVTVNSAIVNPTGTVSFYVCSPATLAAHSVTTCSNVIGTLVNAPSLPAGAGGSATVYSAGHVANAVGSWCFAGYYSGDGNYPASSDATSGECFIADAPAATPTTTTLTASPNPSTTGQTVTFTATVAPTPDGATVSFADGSTVITGCGAVTVVSGQATCSTTFSTAGAHSITATYSGDALFAGSVSAVVSQTVSVPVPSVPKTGAAGDDLAMTLWLALLSLVSGLLLLNRGLIPRRQAF